MGDGANIEQADALYRLRDSLAGFQDNCQEIVDQALTGLQREESWIAERVQFWTAEVAAREAALAACQATVSEDGAVPDCSGPAARLREATLALAKAKLWQERIQSAGESFRHDAGSFTTTLTKCSGARTFLDRKGQRVDTYSQDSFERSDHGPQPPSPANFGSGSSLPQLHLGGASHTLRTSPRYGAPSGGSSSVGGGRLPLVGSPGTLPPEGSPPGGSPLGPPIPTPVRSRAAQLLSDLNRSLEHKEE